MYIQDTHYKLQTSRSLTTLELFESDNKVNKAPVPPHPKDALFFLRSGDCGGHFSTVKSLSSSRNQFEMIQAL